ncbi:MAG: peptidyl-prolyl cis-trans isomerase [Butyricicoccus sp.]|nr:peptidyl-prolyl cis-trans isomerase [Butyricicoccus sp.]
MKKKLSALLALVMTLTCLTACGQSAAPETTPEPTATPEATPAPKKDPDRYDLAYAAYAPDDVVLTVDGIGVTWAEYYYWIHTVAYQVQQMTALQDGAEVDWSAALDAEHTYQSYAESFARDTLTQYVVVEEQAEALGIELSEGEQAEIDAIYAEDVAEYGDGDEAAFADYLAGCFIPREMYDKMNTLSVYYLKLFEHYFGEMGASLPDADALAYAGDAGYMHAKHILIRTVDDGGSPLSDKEIEAAHARAEKLLSQLKALSGEELEEKFDELMNENSEDGGLVTAPDGYYFTPGKFVQPFEDAVNALADGEMYPELVESTYGYHIILRLPMDVDEPMDYTGYTLRYIAASALFSNMSEEWFDSAEVEYTDKFANLDFNTLFAAPEK